MTTTSIDYVVGILDSARWDAEVLSFVDEHCLHFTGEEENSIILSKLHEEFKLIVDRVIADVLEEAGMTEEEFCDSCKAGYVNQKIISQILALDDFLIFKRIMFERNSQLDIEAKEAIDNLNNKVDYKMLSPQVDMADTCKNQNTENGRSNRESNEKEYRSNFRAFTSVKRTSLGTFDKASIECKNSEDKSKVTENELMDHNHLPIRREGKPQKEIQPNITRGAIKTQMETPCTTNKANFDKSTICNQRREAIDRHLAAAITKPNCTNNLDVSNDDVYARSI